ncbi:hypothetical protein NL676_037226 [Syzygium grande]|nr:hypothetical protein NL676_037226 [Syzygium grande]
MSNACLPKKSSKENSKVGLHTKRGQVKGSIFSWVVKKVADIASMARLGRKRNSVPNERASAKPLKTSAWSQPKQEQFSRFRTP